MCSIAVASVAGPDLGLVDLGARQALQARDLVERQIGRLRPQEPPDIGVGALPPELPVIVQAPAAPSSSHTAPCAVLPILAPSSAVAISGVVTPKISIAVDPAREDQLR